MKEKEHGPRIHSSEKETGKDIEGNSACMVGEGRGVFFFIIRIAL